MSLIVTDPENSVQLTSKYRCKHWGNDEFFDSRVQIPIVQYKNTSTNEFRVNNHKQEMWNMREN
jgi:hypothetical protein